MDETQRVFEDAARPLRGAGENRNRGRMRATAAEQRRPGELVLRPQLPHPGGFLHSAEATRERTRGRGTVVPGSAADQFRGGRGQS